MNKLLSEKDANTIRDILVEQLGVKPEQLTPNAHLTQDLGADSLTRAEIALALEEQFKLSMPDADWEGVATVEDVFAAIADALQKTELRK